MSLSKKYRSNLARPRAPLPIKCGIHLWAGMWTAQCQCGWRSSPNPDRARAQRARGTHLTTQHPYIREVIGA